MQHRSVAPGIALKRSARATAEALDEPALIRAIAPKTGSACLEPRFQQRELRHRAAPGGIVIECREQGDEIRDIAPRFDLGRDEAGVLQEPVRGAQIFGYEPVIVEDERPAGARETVELAPGNRLLDARFRERVEKRETARRHAPSRIPA